ncbi:MAG: hypothetical protein JO244_03330, partial [Solirubrobacterales bacterium]|nr:hypothetical protein [Solirubrobacterales bacterium]
MEGGLAIELESEPDGLLAARLIEQTVGRPGHVLMIARSETRAARLAQAVKGLAPDLDALLLPAWDCLPYDRASPSPPVMGARMDVLRRLSTRPDGPVLLIASTAAAAQRLPPPASWTGVELRTGESLDPADLERRLGQLGYTFTDRVDEPGEVAIRGAVIDAFPPDRGLPCRIEHGDGRITEIRRFDPLSQRSQDAVDALMLGPASELVLPEDAGQRHERGIEHALPSFYQELITVFDLMPAALLVLDAEAEDLHRQYWADLREAFEAVRALAARGRQEPLPPGRLYVDEDAWKAALQDRPVRRLSDAPSNPPGILPRFRGPTDFATFIRERLGAGFRIGLPGPAGPRRALLRAIGRTPERGAGWIALRDSPPGTLASLEGELEAGFVDTQAAVIAPADLLGARGLPRSGDQGPVSFETGLAPGDAVIHLDHGLGVLRGIETVAAGDSAADYLRLDYAGDASLLVPAAEMDRIWRYGADAGTVTLDRLNGEGWPKRRAGIEQDVAETARGLVALARQREAAQAPVMKTRGPAYARIIGRFPYLPTPDQAEAFAAVEADLASGTPMDRLVCGDVGYGKTEVALR